MLRLIERGLMFGNLVKVSTPALVERYNAALDKLVGRRTALTEFHIDLSGFSPEIGEELDDECYLNPNGCNRLFILLNVEQKRAPLLNAHFSTSRSILRRFYDANEPQLFALSLRDAVVGELHNSTFRLQEPANIFDIRTIMVEADTVGGLIAVAAQLGDLIQRFETEDDSWWDEQLIARMIELTVKVGDIKRNPVALQETSFQQANFYTTHFGGLYVFRDLDKPAVIRIDPSQANAQLPIDTVIDLSDTAGIAKFFEANNLVESIFEAKGLDAIALLRQRIDFILVDQLARDGEMAEGLSRQDLRRVARSRESELPDIYHALSDALRWAEQGGRWPELKPDNPAWIYTLRSCVHADRDLVNMLLAQLTPLDVRQLFICHKAEFYRAYSGWAEAKRAYVANFLAKEYAIDKKRTRARLFGGEEAMEEPIEAPTEQSVEKPKKWTGPWG